MLTFYAEDSDDKLFSGVAARNEIILSLTFCHSEKILKKKNNTVKLAKTVSQ